MIAPRVPVRRHFAMRRGGPASPEMPYPEPSMALFHRATITPTKAELIAEWAPIQRFVMMLCR